MGQYVPVSFQGVACRGSSAGCSCQSFCNGHKDMNNPECCGCRDGGKLATRAEDPQDFNSTENRTTSFHTLGVALAAAAGQFVPAWCQYVPVSFQGVACRGSSAGCSCQSLCNGHKDVNNPECCGCGDGGADLSSTEKDTTSSHTSGQVLSAASGQSVPAWCQYVPESFQR